MGVWRKIFQAVLTEDAGPSIYGGLVGSPVIVDNPRVEAFSFDPEKKGVKTKLSQPPKR
jgi:hypothetical protein